MIAAGMTTTSGRAYRFFFHYNKYTGGMTVHYRKQCIAVDDITCNVSTETKWNKSQPRLVVQGFAKEIRLEKGRAIIS